MAGVTALRDAARGALLSAGGRGFVRFAPEGDALLISDANRRCKTGEEVRLIAALEAAGFEAWMGNELLNIALGDGLLSDFCGAQPEHIALPPDAEWFETAAFAGRLAGRDRQPLTIDGKRLVLETMRLLWRPRAQVMDGVMALRAQTAAMLRLGDHSGMHEAGRLLFGWLKEQGI